jgi:hypothetical protein
MEEACIKDFVDVIRKFDNIEVVQISWKNLAWIISEVLRVALISKKVSVKEVALLEDPQSEKCE